MFEIYQRDMILAHVQELTPYLESTLEALAEKHDCIKARRGMGFMQGLEIEGRPVSGIVSKALEKGLVIISAGTNVLRLVPPLVITRTQIDEMAGILDQVLSE